MTDLLVVFGLSVAVVLVTHRIRLPPIVGFLITGVLCGPYGFGLIRNVEEVESLAEIGVMLLLFTVGIEFSVQKLVRMRTFLFLGGGLQMAATIAVIIGAARYIGEPWRAAAFLGMLGALSSTAIVLRLLADHGEVDTPHGQAALGILIFQDLCIVPMVLLTPFLTGAEQSISSVAAVAAKAIGFVVAAIVAARYAIPWLLLQVVSTRKREVFLLTIILLCLGTAWASARVGLSLALGAFIAGLVVSESEYSHQALGEMLPLREVFNSLFFVSIGMLFDIRTVLASPLTVLGALIVVLSLKAIVAVGVTFALGQSLRVAVLAGLAISQIGEFSFVLSKVGLEAGLLDARLNQLFLAVAVGTMATAPALIAVAPRVANWLERRVPSRWAAGRATAQIAIGHDAALLEDHVIIVGYGLNGRNLARVLGRSKIPFCVIEMNPEAVRAERRRGRPIIYGDAARPEILEHAGVGSARVAVIAISDAAATRSTVVLARRLNPHIHILVRSRYVHEMQPLVALGTNEVISEEYETSIEIFSRVLRRYLLPRDVVERMILDVRSDGYEMFRTISDAHAPAAGLDRFLTGLSIETYRVESGSPVAGMRLRDSRIREHCGASAVAVQRHGGETIANPAGADTLEAGDSVLLLGRPQQLSAAAELFRTPGGPERDSRVTTESLSAPEAEPV
ncbi:MAG: cation:proton antiporter [Gemmatimonadaceae bacterium]